MRKKTIIVFTYFIVFLCKFIYSADGDHLVDELRSKKFSSLDQTLESIQNTFESGEISDIELRQVYRQFLTITPEDLQLIDSWIQDNPKSYGAHLIKGTYLKRAATQARGTEYIANTPPQQLEEMDRLLKLASTELKLSQTLTQKPFLSIFHLLDIAGMKGERTELKKLILIGNKYAPNNSILRFRFQFYLPPRWGGSHEEMQNFIDKCKSENVAESTIHGLEALREQDIGFCLWEKKNIPAAKEHFKNSIFHSKKAGEGFQKDWLSQTTSFAEQFPEIDS